MVHSTHFEVSTTTHAIGRRNTYPQQNHHHHQHLFVPSGSFQMNYDVPNSPSSVYLDEYTNKPASVRHRAVSYCDEDIIPQTMKTNEIHRFGTTTYHHQQRHQQQMMFQQHRSSSVDHLGIPDLSSSSSIIPDESEQEQRRTLEPRWTIHRSMAFSEDAMEEEEQTGDCYFTRSSHSEAYDYDRCRSILEDDDEDSLDEYIENSMALYNESSVGHSSSGNWQASFSGSSGFIITPNNC